MCTPYRVMAKTISVDFEVFGTVQGVWFRKYTVQQARQLGLVGYCANTQKGTVQGRVQGPECSIEVMKQWLSTTGSPLSRITTCRFSNEHEISNPEYESFGVKHF